MRKEWHDERREHIVTTAEALFSRDGYESVTMAKIALTSGVATGTLYNYFPSKPSLIVDIFSIRLGQLMTASSPDSLEEWVLKVFSCYTHYSKSEWRTFLAALYSDKEGNGLRSWSTQNGVIDSLGRLVSAELGEQQVDSFHSQATRILFGIFYQGFLRWINSNQETTSAMAQVTQDMCLVLKGFSLATKSRAIEASDRLRI